MTVFKTDIAEGLMQSSPFLVADMDSGVIYHASESLEQMFGYKIVGILEGQCVEVLLPQSIQPVHVQHRADYAKSPRSRLSSVMGQGLHLEGQHKDGHVFPVEVLLMPRVVSGTACVYAIVFDMTTRQSA